MGRKAAKAFKALAESGRTQEDFETYRKVVTQKEGGMNPQDNPRVASHPPTQEEWKRELRENGWQEEPDGSFVKEGRPMAEKAKKTPRRLQVKLGKKAEQQLENIKKLAESESDSEVVRNALRLYEWYLVNIQSGKRSLLVEEDGVIERLELLL